MDLDGDLLHSGPSDGFHGFSEIQEAAAGETHGSPTGEDTPCPVLFRGLKTRRRSAQTAVCDEATGAVAAHDHSHGGARDVRAADAHRRAPLHDDGVIATDERAGVKGGDSADTADHGARMAVEEAAAS